MTVNGEPKLTCETFIRDYNTETIKIEPLAHFPVIRDLVINMQDFMEKLPTVSPWLITDEDKPLEAGEFRARRCHRDAAPCSPLTKSPMPSSRGTMW